MEFYPSHCSHVVPFSSFSSFKFFSVLLVLLLVLINGSSGVQPICYRHYVMFHGNKKDYLTISANCCVKNLEIMNHVFLMTGEKKNKIFNRKKFCVCLELSH